MPAQTTYNITLTPASASKVYDGTKLTVRCSGGRHNLIRILAVLQEAELGFGRVYSELPTLNDVFLEITGTALRDSKE